MAIGGGQVYVPCKPPETLAIDREIVSLGASQVHPRRQGKLKVLFIPTASGDDLGYCHSLYNIYEVRLGCDFDCLRILAEKLSDKQIREKILTADIVYVGGGNTLKMMRAWRRRGVDRLLVEASEQGKVMAGLSAGAICWFDWGPSDSRRFSNPKDWKPIKVRGLGLLKMAFCPHYDSEGEWRKPAFKQMLAGSPLLGFACEDDAAVEIVGDQYRLIRSQLGNAYLSGGNACTLLLSGDWQRLPRGAIL
jgi:dipeptidase E